MRTIILTGSLMFFALCAGAQTTAAKDAPADEPLLRLPMRELIEIPFTGKEDDIMFIIPNPSFDKKIVTIDMMPQAGAFRINFPEP